MQEALPRPKKGFARKLGGNSAAQDVKAYEEKVKAEKEDFVPNFVNPFREQQPGFAPADMKTPADKDTE